VRRFNGNVLLEEKNSMEQFIVSARKYRPQTFNDVVGQKPLPILLNAIESNHLASAIIYRT
jgi:DNA polymerase-3 subunit gamma/tau